MTQEQAAAPGTVACHTYQREVPHSDAARADPAAIERKRIEFLVNRDGLAAATQWVRRTVGIYRRAVLDPRHHASRQDYRAEFIQRYCAFKSWLTTETLDARAS